MTLYNPLEELEEVYNGQTFPEYYYKDSLLSLNAEYNGRTELLQLPDETLAIKKAIDRLGAPAAEDCRFTSTFHKIGNDEWTKRIKDIISEEGIYEANDMLKALDKENLDWDKLSAVMELADIGKASNIALLAERLDEFGFIARADSERDVGQHFVYGKPEYALHADMEDFFDFKGFGEHIALERHGRFVSGGFVYYDGSGHIDDVLDDLEPENQGMTMGGM